MITDLFFVYLGLSFVQVEVRLLTAAEMVVLQEAQAPAEITEAAVAALAAGAVNTEEEAVVVNSVVVDLVEAAAVDMEAQRAQEPNAQLEETF